MQIFKCHKLVKPTLMTRLEYNQYRGWDLPKDEDGSDEGFLVEYLDGGKPNHPHHEGYISWSPKDMFLAGYSIYKPEWLERVIVEKMELDLKISKLSEFIDSSMGAAVETAQNPLLNCQLDAMKAYSAVLLKRIEVSS